MEYQPFIIDVPAGEGHQEYCTIFAGALPPTERDVRPNEGDRRYSITISTSLIVGTTVLNGAEDLLGKLRIKKNMVNISSPWKPTVCLRHKTYGMMSAVVTAEFLERTFHDMHWIGLTPDRIVRYIPKRLLVQPFDYKNRFNSEQVGTGLSLTGVEMDPDDITLSMKEMREVWRSEQEERFGDWDSEEDEVSDV